MKEYRILRSHDTHAKGEINAVCCIETNQIPILICRSIQISKYKFRYKYKYKYVDTNI